MTHSIDMTEKDITIELNGSEGSIMAKLHEGSIRQIGKAVQLEDGFWYYWHDGATGAERAWVLRAIADRLDELNRPWEEIIERDLGPAAQKKEKKEEENLDEMHCDHCDKETIHRITGECHERHSDEVFTCTECGWYKFWGEERLWPPVE